MRFVRSAEIGLSLTRLVGPNSPLNWVSAETHETNVLGPGHREGSIGWDESFWDDLVRWSDGLCNMNSCFALINIERHHTQGVYSTSFAGCEKGKRRRGGRREREEEERWGSDGSLGTALKGRDQADQTITSK